MAISDISKELNNQAIIFFLVIDTVKFDILDILTKSRAFLEFKESAKLRELSNHTIHDASIFQDEDAISMAVVMYALSKIMERGTIDMHSFGELLAEAKNHLELDKISDYKNTIKKLFDKISRTDSKFKLYVEEVLTQSQIKKGSKLYEHGISLEQASYLLGITQWELMHYIGQTSIMEEFESTGIRKRLSIARELFK